MTRSRDQEIVLSLAQWKGLEPDERLWDLLALARVTNALAQAYQGLLISVDYQSPRSRRNRAAALLYAAALIFEGLQVSRRLAKHYRELPQFKAGFGALHSDPKTQHLESAFLKPLRDKTAFHFDREVFQKAVGLIEFPEVRVASARGWNPGAVYFDIADEAIFAYLTGAKNDQEHLAKLEEFMTGTSRLVNSFIRSSHKLLATAFRQLGGKMRPIKIGHSAV
jgi:hypothetical protein